MGSLRRTLLGMILAALPALTQSSPAPSTIAFENANVIPMISERILKQHTVLVRGDRIIDVAPTAKTKVPEGTTRIDASGKWLIPGLAEMHGHVPPPNAPGEVVETVLFLYVSNGVTTVRGMLGAPNQLDLRARANRGEIVAPTLYLAGPSFSGTSVKTSDEAIARVRQQKAEGWDLIKVHPGLTRETYDAMARTAKEVGLRFAGHVPADVGILHALASGQETIDHLDGYIEYLAGDKNPVSDSRLAELAGKTNAAGAWVVPTMALWESILGVPPLERLRSYEELRYMPMAQVEGWIEDYRKRLASPQFDRKASETIASNRKRLLGVFNRRGVRILFGTDAPQIFSVPGFSIHREIPYMLESGMRPFEILRSATRNVGEYFKTRDRFGTIEKGARADLVLLEADPLANLANLQKRAGVVVRGKWLSGAEIEARLQKLAR